jgi:hypothetical protein
MKKKFLISSLILLALVCTSGALAFIYPGTAGTTLEASIVEATMNNCEPSSDQPDWESILPDIKYNREILRPCASGDMTFIPLQSPLSGDHWEKVAELSADDDITYISNDFRNHFEEDLYTLTDYAKAGGYETITEVSVYFRFAGGQGAAARATIKTNETIFRGKTEINQDCDFVTKSYKWSENPATHQPWTWDEISRLQAGVALKSDNYGGAVCTQVYVVVKYEYAIIQGAVPCGGLFDIIPESEETGDLFVKVYLTNAAELLKAYRHLNMKVYLADSLESQQSPAYQVLSTESEEVTFNVEGGYSESYLVEITGGSYCLVSSHSFEWEEGWSIVPEFYCEVTQR